MKQKMARLLKLIYDFRQEVSQITRGDNEYYFLFRGKYFSVSGGNSATPAAFFAYPKYFGSIAALASSQVDTPFAFADASEVRNFTGQDLVVMMYHWLDDKNMGLDEMFQQLGIT